MAYCRLVFALLVLSVVSCYGSVPVFSWGDLEKTYDKSNPLNTLSQEEFGKFLKNQLVEQPLTVVFVEQGLSVEDFSSKNADGETPFSYLVSNLGNSVYQPSVEKPLAAFERFAGEDNSDVITLFEDGLSEEITSATSGDSKFLFIKLKDAREGETRPQLLERHDKFMQEVISNLRKDPEVGKIIAIYTAEYPSWTVPLSRSRRAASSVSGLSGLRMTVTNITLHIDNTTTVLSNWVSAQNTVNDTAQTNTLNFGDTTITLNFQKKSGYWFFDTVTLNTQSAPEEHLVPVTEVYAIVGFSYRCMQHVAFTSVNLTKTYVVDFEDLKIQPFFVDNTTLPEFGDAFNCVGFFSAPIWAGLFVVFILLSITFYGIMMMMDIRTMDRFDDPKGKTITINAGE